MGWVENMETDYRPIRFKTLADRTSLGQKIKGIGALLKHVRKNPRFRSLYTLDGRDILSQIRLCLYSQISSLIFYTDVKMMYQTGINWWIVEADSFVHFFIAALNMFDVSHPKTAFRICVPDLQSNNRNSKLSPELRAMIALKNNNREMRIVW